MQGSRFVRTVDYNGPSPICPFCESSNTKYEKGIYVLHNTVIDLTIFETNELSCKCFNCHKKFKYDYVAKKYLKGSKK